MRYHYKVMRMAKIKSPKLQAEQCELPNSAGSSVNWKKNFIIKKKGKYALKSMEVMFWRKFSITWSLNHTLPLTHGLQSPWAGAEERILFALIALAHPELGALAGKIPGNSIKPRVRHLSASPASFFQLYPYLHFHLCSLCQNKPRRREEKSHNKKFRWIHSQEIFG